MSLIIEALKRARDDSVRRQAASKGLPMAPVPRIQGRSRWLTLALIPLAGALAVCILLLVDLYSSTPQLPADPAPNLSQLPADASTVESQSFPASSGSSPISQPESSLASDSTVPSTPVAPETNNMRPPQPAQDNSLASRELATDQGTGESFPPTASVESFSAPSPTQANATGREFVGQAQLQDGQLVDLGGIAWSESEPFALLNGQVIGVGELIRSYRVIEIQPDRVVMEQDDDRIVLRLN